MSTDRQNLYTLDKGMDEFNATAPPPAYSQQMEPQQQQQQQQQQQPAATPIVVAPNLNMNASMGGMMGPHLGGQVGPSSMELNCPHCRCRVKTRIRHRSTAKTHFACLLLLSCCLCCIPYCMNSCRNANHFCPMCGGFIGTYQS